MPNHSSSPLGEQRQKALSRRRSESASHNRSRRAASLPHIHRRRHPHLENEQDQKVSEKQKERDQWTVGFYFWPPRTGTYNHHIYGGQFRDSKAREVLYETLGRQYQLKQTTIH